MMQPTRNRLLQTLVYILLLLFVAGDLVYSFRQHRSQPLDGDMAGGIVPAEDVRPLFSHPFGAAVLFSGESYSNPNKFFSHWMFREYFTHAPLAIQTITTPVESVYLASAWIKTIIQALLILVLAFAVTGSANPLRMKFMAAAALVTPLFQTNGYRGYMGIIDTAPTYVFFYALPLLLLLINFAPLLFRLLNNRELHLPVTLKALWVPLAIVVCLSGPLNPGIVLVVSALLSARTLRIVFQNRKTSGLRDSLRATLQKVPGDVWFYLLPVTLFSAYSLFLGTFNPINNESRMSILTLYQRLPEGIYLQFFQKPGFPVLFTILIINAFLISIFSRPDEKRRIMRLYRWAGIFSIAYILLLPLGGYREYRPGVLRYDTILPVTIVLLFLFASTTLSLIRQFRARQRFWYVPVILGVGFIFQYADQPEPFKNQCEKEALLRISKSADSVVAITQPCMVLSWEKIKKPEDSDMNAQLLRLWRVTKEKKLYYHQEP